MSTDRYRYQVRVLGACVNFAPKVVLFTSNEPLDEWWPKDRQEHRDAFRRRITDHIELEQERNPEDIRALFAKQ